MKYLRIFIEKLGAIRNSEIEVSPLMIFSGESGLGKSYASFLVHYVYVLLSTGRNDRFSVFFKKKGYDFKSFFENWSNENRTFSINKEELLNWINTDAIDYIRYLLGHDSLEGKVNIQIPIEDLVFYLEEDIMGLENEEEIFYKLSLGSINYRLPISAIDNADVIFEILLIAHIRTVLFGNIWPELKTFLMPPSRGSLVELTSRPAFLSGMYEEFFENKEDLARPVKDASYTMPDILRKCLLEINDGNVRRVENKIFYHTNGNSMPITAAASSIKELAPLTLFFQRHHPKDASILFEEPEAHLHPKRQIKVADLIACAVGLGCHVQITTHSDYFLKRINNLMLLFQLKNKKPEKFKEICAQFDIKEDAVIDLKIARAYVLKKRDDGSTEILSQTIGEEGIPFSSFYDVINDDLESSISIKDALFE